MSNATVQRHLSDESSVRVAPLRLVGGTHAPQTIATVTPISQAPSARLRRARLLAEDPAMRRRPPIVTQRAVLTEQRAKRAGEAEQVDVSARDHARHGSAASGARTLNAFARSAGYAICLALTIVGATALGISMQPTPYTGPTIEHSVVAGDSVWSLAAAVGSERPLEEVVLDIQRMNDLESGLQPGQSLILPTR